MNLFGRVIRMSMIYLQVHLPMMRADHPLKVPADSPTANQGGQHYHPYILL